MEKIRIGTKGVYAQSIYKKDIYRGRTDGIKKCIFSDIF